MTAKLGTAPRCYKQCGPVAAVVLFHCYCDYYDYDYYDYDCVSMGAADPSASTTPNLLAQICGR